MAAAYYVRSALDYIMSFGQSASQKNREIRSRCLPRTYP